MSPVVKFKSGHGELVPESSVEHYRQEQSLADAKFRRDRLMQNLQARFAAERDAITKAYLDEAREIMGE